MFPDVYIEHKTEKIVKASNSRPFFTRAEINWKYDQVNAPYLIEGECNIVVSPEFDCEIKDFLTNEQILLEYCDAPYGFGGVYTQMITEMDLYLNGNCLGESFESSTIFNSPCMLENRITNVGIDSLYVAGQLRGCTEYWIDWVSGGRVYGGQCSDNRFFENHKLFVKSGENLKMVFRIRPLKINDSDSPYTIPGVFFSQANLSAKKYIVIHAQTLE